MSRSTAPAAPVVRSAWLVPGAVAVILIGLAGFLCWQYAMPRAFESSFLLNHAGVEHFRGALGLPSIVMAAGPYRLGFRLWLALIWAAYFVAVLGGAMGAPQPRRAAVTVIVVGAAAGAALLWPPSFSVDVYGYVGYGRLRALYGLNPYATTQDALVALHDVTGPFLRWNIASPYGPLWTLLSTALAWLLRGTSLFVQIVAFKAIAAAALVGAAFGGRRIAERLAPGRGDLTFLAIGLNPLFVMEGPGNGHNDLVMMALVVATMGAALDGRAVKAAALAGVAGAIKFLPLLLVPWICSTGSTAWDAWRARPADWRRVARDGLGLAAAAVIPLVVSYWPYWLGARRTLFGLQQRWRNQPVAGGDMSQAALVQGAAVLLLYAAATVWVVRGDRARLLTGWAIVCAGIFLVATGTWLPWYLTWIWMVSLVGWDRRSATISYLAFCFAIVLTLRYSVPGGG